MNVLVVGSGGREHALVWKLRQSSKVSSIICAPGNAGIAQLAETVPTKADDLQGLLELAKKRRVDLTVVGPEIPLVAGIVDLFIQNGLRIFGPTKRAAELEGSKVASKRFMDAHGVPTAPFAVFTRKEQHDAERYVLSRPAPMVVKADGLAAGKGAVVCATQGEAVGVITDFFERGIFGDAGNSVVVEDFMSGEEASILVLTDGTAYHLLPAAQDHKQILDGDRGKNTGGMGAYAPAPVITPALAKRVEREIVAPVLDGMRAEGRPYAGCLYVGLMITAEGPKVVEFNCRFGDPEAQAVLPLLAGDVYELLEACASHTLGSKPLKLHRASSVCVVMASRGYPDAYETGKVISGLQSIRSDEGAVVFHAGTKQAGDDIVTAGGRVLGVTAIGYGNELQKTITAAYSAVSQITFDGAYYRSDIGRKALKHLGTSTTKPS